MDGSAADVDEEEAEHIGECPATTRQFWACYYGNALGRLIVARSSLRASLLDEVEAGDWENRWHVAAVLFEGSPESGTSTVNEPSSFTTLQISSMISKSSHLGMQLDHLTSTPKLTSTGQCASGSPTLIRIILAKRQVP